MRAIWPRRAGYRAGQFGRAVQAAWAPLRAADFAEARDCLPLSAWPLFARMARADQRHSLAVLRALRVAGHDHPALLQAALLHDCAKAAGGVRLWHRVAVVLLRALWPAACAGRLERPAPPRRHWRYPFWAHAHHPALGAEMAAAAGCDPLAVALIRYHQDGGSGAAGSTLRALLAALQAADNDN